MPPASSTATSAPTRIVVLTRVFDAPRDLVFRAWTDPRQLAQWWGPHNFTNPRCEVDVRPGGALRIDMRGPDGVVYPCAGVFREVVEPERLVFTTAALDAAGNAMFEVLNTVTFVEHQGKTKLTLHAEVASATPQADRFLAGMEEGWSQSLERLASLVGAGASVAAAASGDEPGASARTIVTTREFDAPRDLVFRMWIEPEHVAKWWGPNGFTTTIDRMDVRPGGVWQFVMHGPDGTDYQNRIVYEEIARPERLAYSHVSFPVFRSTVTFAEESGKTRVTMRMVFESATDYDAAVTKFGAIEGGRQTFARLGEYLAQIA